MYTKQGAKENETICVIHSRHRRCSDVSVYVCGHWCRAEGIQRDLHFPLQRSHSVAGRHKLSALKKSIKKKERYSMSKVSFFPLYTAWSSVHTELQQLSEQKLFIFNDHFLIHVRSTLWMERYLQVNCTYFIIL